MYDIIIIGAGAAGITAAIYAARAKLNFEVISEDVGGLTLWSSNIENYTGYHNLTGIDLIDKFTEHMKDYDIKVKEEKINIVEKKENGFLVKSDKGEYEAKTVLVCSGSRPRQLEVPGGKEYEKKGLFYCATCDGPLMSGKEVVIIGGGDGALDAANVLIQSATKITILNRGDNLTGTDQALAENVKKNEKVVVINNSEITEVYGEQFVTGVKYKIGEEVKDLAVGGVFVEIGHIRNNEFVKDLVTINKGGEIETDKTGKTSIEGIYSAGDITDLPGKQTVIACGDGARALLSAFNFITRK